jgi:TolB-like protein
LIAMAAFCIDSSGGHAQSRGSVQDGIDELASQIVSRSAAADRTTIAISAFPHINDSCSELSNFLVDELVLSLFTIPDNQLSIIERSQLGRIFAELELSLSGAIDVNTTRELGRIHGVETLLVGSLTTVGDDLRVNARLINTETAQVFSAAAVNIPRTSTIEDLMQRPAAGGCTMAAGGNRTTGTSPGSGGASAPVAAVAGLGSIEDLLGLWTGLAECGGSGRMLTFEAREKFGRGVSGVIAGARDGAVSRVALTHETGNLTLPADFVMVIDRGLLYGRTGTVAGRTLDLVLTDDGRLVGKDREGGCESISLSKS